MNFIVYASIGKSDGSNGYIGRGSDRIIIENGKDVSSNSAADATQTHYLAVATDDIASLLSASDLYTKDGANNIALATVKDTSHIKLQSTNNINGFTLVNYEFVTDKTNKDGKTKTQQESSSPSGTPSTMSAGVMGKDGSSSADTSYTTYFLGSAKNVTSNMSISSQHELFK